MQKKRSHQFRLVLAMLAAAAAFSVIPETVLAGGLLGDIFVGAGRAIGIKPIEDLGKNMDAEHKRFKENNPIYKTIEETGSEIVRNPFSLACTTTFESIISAVRYSCGQLAFHSQANMAAENSAINRSIQRLISIGVTSPSEFSGVSIGFCQGDFKGLGIAPGPNEIILNKALLNVDDDARAATIAHELHHLRQFRSMGAGPFKCNYSQQFLSCAGCQDDRHPMEREAYQFENSVVEKLNNSSGKISTKRIVAFSQLRGTGTFLDQPPPTFPHLNDELPQTALQKNIDIRRISKKVCSLDGDVDLIKVENCIDDMEVIFDDMQQVMREASDKTEIYETAFYYKIVEDDFIAACEIVGLTMKSTEGRKTRARRCLLHAKQGVRDLRSKIIEAISPSEDITYSATQSKGLSFGTLVASCACWGYVFIGQLGPSAICASGKEISFACPGICSGGGSPWGTRCR